MGHYMFVGIDVGGTCIKAGVVDERGRVIAKSTVESHPESGEAMVRLMYTAMARAADRGFVSRDKITAIGIGSSGICDNNSGTIIYSGNIKYHNTPVREFFMERINARIDVDNDANCAAVGEYIAAGENCQSFVFVTLGTGVGGGIILNGKLLRGTNGGAGEIGHMVFRPGGRPCGCGQNGCWEAYASVTGLINDARERGGWFASEGCISGRTPFQGAVRGIPEALEVRDNWIKNVAMGICSLVNIFQPDRLVIGGGISKEGETLLAPIREYVSKNVYTHGIAGIRQTQISAAKLGNDAGIVGAAFLHKII